jgi:hypothetical protein
MEIMKVAPGGLVQKVPGSVKAHKDKARMEPPDPVFDTVKVVQFVRIPDGPTAPMPKAFFHFFILFPVHDLLLIHNG